MRYTVKELREIMRTRGIAYSGLTKPKMCARLYGQNMRVSPPKPQSNFSILKNTEQIRRGGRVKKISSFTRSNLIGFASKLGLGHGSKATKKNLTNLLLGKSKKSPSPMSSSLGSFANELERQFQKETEQKKNNMINSRARLMFNNTNAPQFANYYRLHGGTPSKLNRLANNFRALKLKEQFGKYKGAEII